MERNGIREEKWLFKCLFLGYASSIRATGFEADKDSKYFTGVARDHGILADKTCKLGFRSWPGG
jgi:hypothetical protein